MGCEDESWCSIYAVPPIVTLNTDYVTGCSADAGLVYHIDDVVTNMIKETLIFPVTTLSFKQNLIVRITASLLYLTTAVCHFLSAYFVVLT